MALGAESFWVYGTPQTQGSMRAFVIGKRAVVTSTNKQLKSWRERVAEAARKAGWGDELIDGPVHLQMHFRVARPRSHFNAKGLKASAPELPASHVGDLDKLVRAIGDALTGVIWTDDRRIVSIVAKKDYAIGSDGVHILVIKL